MKPILPKKICSFDIETAKTAFGQPENSVLAVAGAMEFILRNGRYYAGKYQYFLSDQMDELQKYLATFPGIIIGHNILSFDYRVLRAHFSLKGIIEKSVDTLALLFKKNDSQFTGLNLDELSMRHFGGRKTLHGRQMPILWEKGKHQKVIKYNKNDCMLTRKLWWHMVKYQSIVVDYHSERHPVIRSAKGPWERVIDISPKELEILTGIRPQTSHRGWIRKINQKGLFLIKQEPRNYIRVRAVPENHCPRCGFDTLIQLHSLLLLDKIPRLTKRLRFGYENRRWRASFCEWCDALIVSGKTFFNYKYHYEIAAYVHKLLDENERIRHEIGNRVGLKLDEVWKFQNNIK